MKYPADDLHKKLTSFSIPKVDLRAKVMEQIYAHEERRPITMLKKKYILVVALLVIFCSTTFGSVKVYQLLSKKGDVLVEFEEVQSNYPPQESEFGLLYSEAYANKQPGKGFVIFYQEGSEVKQISKSWPIQFSTHQAISQHVGTMMRIPETFAGATFKVGRVTNKVDDSSLKPDTLPSLHYTKCLPEITEVFLFYDNPELIIDLNILYFYPKKYYVEPDSDGKLFEHVKVNGNDALYNYFDDSQSRLTWVSETATGSTLFMLGVTRQDTTKLTKEDVIKVAEMVRKEFE